jgi:hypothetical protein
MKGTVAGEARQARRRDLEIGRLARILREDPERLAYLRQLGCEEIVALREAVAVCLHEASAGALGPVAAAARILPVALTAAIGERAFGPLLCARLASLLELERAVDVATRLPAWFLAEVAGELEPGRAAELVAQLTPQLIADVTRELAAREDWYAMGRFVGRLEPEALAASMAVLDDLELLEVAFVIEERRQLPRLIECLELPRLRRIIACAAAEGRWPATLELVGDLGEPQRRMVAAAAVDLPDTALPGLVDAVVAESLWDRLSVIVGLEPDLRDRLSAWAAALPARRRRQVRDSAAAAGAAEMLGPVGHGAAGRPSR